MKILGDDSILRRLPAAIELKQLLFLDGIRHCAEICELSYQRLKNTLTEIGSEAEHPKRLSTAAFVDAWSIVDAIHRFKSLWKLQPGVTLTPPLPPARNIDQEFLEVVRLRNLADHLAQQADRIIKHKGNALGELRWVTVTSTEPYSAVSCVLVAGTAKDGKHSWIVPKKGDVMEFPTGRVQLSVGADAADLSAALACLAKRIDVLENSLALAFSGLSDQRSNGLDLLVKAKLGLEKISDA
jgi:hypothetical protein